MNIQVRFFASLREQLKLDDCVIEMDHPVSVKQVWDQVTGDAALPGNLLCAINMEYVSLEDEVQAGDEVAFFPPVTGG